jgi:hypothetical protein
MRKCSACLAVSIFDLPGKEIVSVLLVRYFASRTPTEYRRFHSAINWCAFSTSVARGSVFSRIRLIPDLDPSV